MTEIPMIPLDRITAMLILAALCVLDGEGYYPGMLPEAMPSTELLEIESILRQHIYQHYPDLCDQS